MSKTVIDNNGLIDSLPYTGPPRHLPAISKAPKDPRGSFTVTSIYHRKGEHEAVGHPDNSLITDDNVNIISQIETTKNILCISYTENYEFIAVGFPDGVVRLLNRDTSQVGHILFDDDMKANTGTVTAITHRPRSNNYPETRTLTCTYTNGYVKCWDYPASRCIYTIREKRQTLCVKYHPRLPKFVTCGEDAKIFLYDEETKTQERIFVGSDKPDCCDGHKSRVFAVCFNPRSQFEFISGGWDDTVQFWDIRQPHAVRRLQNIHLCAEGLDIIKNGKEILTAAWQQKNPLQIWDYSTMKLIQNVNPDPYNSMLYCGKFVDSNFFVVGGCEPNLLRVVDHRTMLTSALLRGLPGGVYSLDIGPLRKIKKGKGYKPELSALPVVALVAGKKIYQVDFA